MRPKRAFVLAHLALANLRQRVGRTLAAVAGVAAPACLALTAMGLAEGTLAGIADRLTAVGADVFVQPPGSSVLLGSGSARLSLAAARRLQQLPSVDGVAPGLLHSVSSLRGRAVALNLWAVDPESFAAVSGGFDVLEGGRGLADPMSVLADETLARELEWGPGSRLELLGRPFRVAGVVRAGTGARLYARLDDVQRLVGAQGEASFFLVRKKPGAEADVLVSQIEQAMPGVTITPIAAVAQSLRGSAVGLSEFEGALWLLVSLLSAGIVFVTTQAAVLERTRQIGVLRALGLGQLATLRLVLIESLALCLAGGLLGMALAGGLADVLPRIFPSLVIRLEPAIAMAVMGWIALGGVLGALAPGLRAARLDPVVALDAA